ncbi:cytochrome P450 [Actinocrispum sp. NPDC049592]|uniref:cytochrome P450 family protein n=1 Tax=Actinocrispum sp. NPDC049592 TaxID=3154835 RepID=UPI00341766F0
MTASTAVFRLPAADESLPDTYARFRAAGPVVPVELPGGVRVWAVTTHAAVREVLAGDDTRFGKHPSHWAALRDGEVPSDWPFLPLVSGEHMLVQDGRDHLRLRALVSREFTPARVSALRPRIVEIVGNLLDALEANPGEVDLVPEFTEQLPLAVVCELLGIPETDLPRLRAWTEILFSHLSTAAQTHDARQEMLAYLSILADHKRLAPRTDLTSAMVRGQDAERLTARELVDCLFLLIIACHETTVHMLGHAIIGLLANPAQLVLAAEGNRWGDVVEEALRRTPPVYGDMFRYALSTTDVAGVPIAAGDALLLCIGGAATDPSHHGPDAAEFDITRFDSTRPLNGHLAFGHGAHFCVGAPLARLEGRIALAALFTRMPALKPAVPLDDIPYSPSFLTYGPLSLPVVPG